MRLSYHLRSKRLGIASRRRRSHLAQAVAEPRRRVANSFIARFYDQFYDAGGLFKIFHRDEEGREFEAWRANPRQKARKR